MIYHVNQSHYAADDCNPGSETQPLKTIQKAADLAMPGDTIMVYSGIYRETVSPPRGGTADLPIRYLAREGEHCVITGSDLLQGEWLKRGVCHVIFFNEEAFEVFNPYATKYRNGGEPASGMKADSFYCCGQLFFDNMSFKQAGTQRDVKKHPCSWIPLPDGRGLIAHFPDYVTDPGKHTIEYTVRKTVFQPAIRGLGYIHLEGFELRHAANQGLTSFWADPCEPQLGLVSCRSGHHFVIKNNFIHHALSIGLDVGGEGRIPHHYPGSGFANGMPYPEIVGFHLIENNHICDNGQGGICGMGHVGTVIRQNRFERNNSLGGQAFEEAAIKMHFYLNGAIENNVFIDNYCDGIWLDNVYQNVSIRRNVILGCNGAGIFLEMGPGPCVIEENLVALSIYGNTGRSGVGIYAHDAFNARIHRNVLIHNARYGIYLTIAELRSVYIYPDDTRSLHQKPDKLIPCHCVDFDIAGNWLIQNSIAEMKLPFDGELARNNLSNTNMFGVPESGIIPFFILHDRAKPDACTIQKIGSALYKLNSHEWLLTFEQWKQYTMRDSDSEIRVANNGSYQIVQSGDGLWLKIRLDKSPSIPFPLADCDPVYTDTDDSFIIELSLNCYMETKSLRINSGR